MKIPFLAWLLQGIPECVALVALSVSLAGAGINRDKIIKVGLLQAITTYIIRLIPFTPGVHVLILLTSLSFFLIWFFKINLKYSVIASAFSVCFLLIFEASLTTTMAAIGLINPTEFLNSPLQRILIGYPQVILLFVLAFYFNKKGWVLGRFLTKINPYE